MRGNKIKPSAIALTLMSIFTAGSYAGQQPRAEEKQAIRTVLARFYDGWNAHDPDVMISIYAEDVDHINVWGEWNKGKDEIRKDLAAIHSASARNSREKIHNRKDSVSHT